MRRSEATALTWADVELRDNGSGLLQVHRSKTDPEGEGVVLYLGKEASEALRTIRPAEQLLDRYVPVFGLSAGQTGRRVDAAAWGCGPGDGYTGHSGRVGKAQDLVKSGVKLPALMTAGRWKSARMPARTPSARRRTGAQWTGITRTTGGVNVTGSCRQCGFQSITVGQAVL